MALPPRLNKFRDLHALTTGIDATSGDKVLAAPADVSVGKILIVLATHYNADAAQDFELKANPSGTVLGRFHLAAQGNNSENGGGLGVFACPAGEGLDVNFANAAVGSLFACAVELVDVPV